MGYVRFETASPNARGVHPGVFAVTNGLARAGRLSTVDHAWWRANNDWFNAAYPDPSSVDPTLFDRSRYPVVSCWFHDSAHQLLARVPGYLALLDRHGVTWRERRSDAPGRILYEDEVQVVVEPAAQSTAATNIREPGGAIWP